MKDFIPFEEAFELKQLGFNEACFGYHYTLDDKHWKFAYTEEFHRIDDELNIGPKFMLLAPTFSQAFRFFREKYGYYPLIEFGEQFFKKWLSRYCNTDGSIVALKLHDTYEEAELACLKRLIELVKQRQ